MGQRTGVASLRWRHQRHQWRRPEHGGFDPSNYDVTEVAHTPARTFVQAHHYTSRWPSVSHTWGLHDHRRDDPLVGIATLGVPTSPRVLTLPFPDLAPYVESLELNRFVLLDSAEANAETWFLARVLRAAARDHGIAGVVAFSDPQPRRDAAGTLTFRGHLGHIYHPAGSATYLGRATARTLRVVDLPDGRTITLSDRALQKVRARESGWRGTVELLCDSTGTPPPAPHRDPAGWLADTLSRPQIRRLRHRGNHRYVWTVGSRRRQVRLGLRAQPHPTELDPPT